MKTIVSSVLLCALVGLAAVGQFAIGDDAKTAKSEGASSKDSIVKFLAAKGQDEEDRPDTTLVDDVTGDANPMPSHWIGVVCVPAEGALRAQLDLPEGAGLVVQSVVPDSPAAEAGLSEYDILIEASGQPLTSLPSLVDAIAKSKDKPMKVKWLHKGEEVSKEITPAERPKEMAWSPPSSPNSNNWSANVDADQLNEWIDKIKKGQVKDGPMRFHFFGPGIPMDTNRKEFTGNLSVEISKESGQPARIKVRRGDESWELTEDNLSELPKDIRGHVRRMLGKGPAEGLMVLPWQSGPNDQGSQVIVPSMPNMQDLPADIRKQFEELQHRMDEMMRQLHEIRDQDQPHEENVDA